MKKILVIGASGFVGGHLARRLLADGYATRCLARDPGRVASLEVAGGEVVRGDVSDVESLRGALESVDAVYISIHTLSAQPAAAGRGFMDVELDGLRNIVAACKDRGVRRLIYITSLGMRPDSPSAWVRGRWEAERALLASGLDVTVLRPGQIVGVGGHGFDMMASQARRRVALVLGGGRQTMRNIAIDDLVYYLVGVLDDPASFGRCLDVGGDDVLTTDQMIDAAADVLGRPHPIKLRIPRAVLRLLCPLIERAAKLPRGAFKGLLDGLGSDMDGDPSAIRAILPRPPLSYRRALERALLTKEIS